VRRVVDAVGALGAVDLEERTTTSESMKFRLPREVVPS